MKYKIVNAAGLAEIRTLLGEYSIYPAEHYTKSMLHAWAADVERTIQENGRAEFEIHASRSASGHTVLCRLSESSLDEQEIEGEIT